VSGRGCRLVFAGLLALALPALARADAARPHLLLLVAEDLGPRIGAFGDSVARTPNLDRLAREGIRYTNAFTTAGVCAPSRAALITGQHQASIGAQHMRASSRPAGGYRSVPDADVKAFPERLRAAGYYTFVTEKLDYQFSGPGTGTGPFTIWDAEDDAALWRDRDPGQPFFGMLNFLETHETGVLAPLGTWPHGVLHLGIQLWRAWRFGLPGGGDPTPPDAVMVPPFYPDTPIVRADIARHYDNIHQMDAAVGEVLARLEADGLADSTVVIFTTDHGDGLPRAKRELLDTGIRVPMIVRWPEAWRPPGALPGSVDEQLISLVDLAPTLLEVAGVAPPDALHGRSFASRHSPPREYVYAARDRMDEVPDRQRAVRDLRFKYIRSDHPALPGAHPLAFRDNLGIMRELRRLHETGALDGEQETWFELLGRERLFDTTSDPWELRNLASDPAYAGVLARMRSVLDSWLERVGDTREIPEDEMVARFEPRGQPEVTAPPSIVVDGGRVSIRSDTPGASLGYCIDADRWRLYTEPFDAPPGSSVRAKAVRYGWDESEEVHANALGSDEARGGGAGNRTRDPEQILE
jgi:N-sulfoglucosamine sulfohydrolase